MLDTRQAIRIGLIVNELATNALKHAFPGDSAGTIEVKLRRHPTDTTIMVEDNGIGCPEEPQGAHGLRLVTHLAQQLRGSLNQQPANQGCQEGITAAQRRGPDLLFAWQENR